MPTTNVSVSLDAQVLAAARAAAREAGMSLSAYLNRCARNEQARINARKYREYLADLTGDDADAHARWMFRASRR